MDGSIAIVNTVSDMSTGKIAEGLMRFLRNMGEKAFLCYGRGARLVGDEYYRIDFEYEVYMHVALSRVTGLQGAYSVLATKRFIKFCREKNVRTVYAISLHGYYLNFEMFFDYLCNDDISLIYIMIDEAPFLGKCCYSAGCENFKYGCGHCPQVRVYPRSLFLDRSHELFSIKQKCYDAVKHKLFVGPEYVIQKAKTSPLLKDIETETLDEAIDLRQVYYPRRVDSLLLELGIDKNKIIIVCIAPSNNPRKGTKYFKDLAERFLGDTSYVFIHVGYVGDKDELPYNYIPIGYEYCQDRLAQYYSVADLFVFPSLLDTMPNACLEAMACGSPLLCFNTSGMPYIADASTATFVEPGNVEKMSEVVKRTSKKNQEIINKCREYAKKRYDSEQYYEKLYGFALNLRSEIRGNLHD